MSKCEFCEKNQPTQRCFNCQLSLCDDCSSTLHSKGTLKTHRRILDKPLEKVLKIEKYFQNSFENTKYSDITLICEDKKFFVHKIVLSCLSETFDKIFSNGMKESKKKKLF